MPQPAPICLTYSQHSPSPPLPTPGSPSHLGIVCGDPIWTQYGLPFLLGVSDVHSDYYPVDLFILHL